MKNDLLKWVYIFITPDIKREGSEDYYLSKIGITSGNPFKRFVDLRAGNPYLFFHAAYCIPNDAEFTHAQIENFVHKLLDDKRVMFEDLGMQGNDTDECVTGSEWFEIQPDSAERCIDQVVCELLKVTVIQRSFDELKVFKLYDSELRELFFPDLHDQAFIEEITQYVDNSGNY